jgi:hypothetical protein
MVVLLGALPYVQYVMYSRAMRAELELKVRASRTAPAPWHPHGSRAA